MIIYIIPTSYPDEVNPVRNVFIYEQVKALSKRHKIVVLNVKKLPSKDLFRHIDSVINVSIDEFSTRYYIEQKTIMDTKMSLYNKKMFCKRMEELFEYAEEKEGTPDVIYAHFSCWAGLAACEIARKKNVPVAVLEHYSGYMEKNCKPFYKKGLKEVANSADVMCAVSDGLKNAMNNIVGKSISINTIPNMIDDCFTFKNKVEKNKFVFLSIANLNKRKRVFELVNTFIKTFNENDPVELRIGGHGEEYEKINGLIKMNRRENQIILLGRLNREQTLKEYTYSDCFVLASSAETFGLVYREAMGVGRPIITTNHGGFSGADWNDGCGLLIDVDDFNGLSKAMVHMVINKEKYDNKYISEYCLSRYSMDTIGAKIETVLSRICE